MASAYFDADLLLASVRAEHQAFYKRVFGHEVLAPPRAYATLVKPLSLMASDYRLNHDAVNMRYPFLRSTLFERRMLFEAAGPSMPVEKPARSLAKQAVVEALAS